MDIEYNASFRLEVKECGVDYLVAAFKQLVPQLLSTFVETVLVRFAEAAMGREDKPFVCECGNRCDFIWKTRNAKATLITTIFAVFSLPQLQVQCKKCGSKMFITRSLLGISRFRRMSAITERMLALVGALTTFRVSGKIFALFGVPLDRMAVWRCVQRVGKTISFSLDPKELPSGQADGTGIPISWIKKRGMELKVFVQDLANGGVRIAGLGIGKWESGWDKVFAPSIEVFKEFKQFLLMTDGDTSILKGLGCVKTLLQRCLWHMPHQLEYCLWQDKVKRKSNEWFDVMGKIHNICGLRQLLDDDEIDAVLAVKRMDMEALIVLCLELGYARSATYLANAKPDMFTALENRLHGKATSLVERVMRTVNMRVNVGKWSPTGALNAMRVRLAHYYNGWGHGWPTAEGVVVSRK